ncbi:hypothetical protein Lal_00001357 [Lupinus albus]|nr:hypothetical protein Lal_00001357 [Lupinus albus]
MKMLQRMSTHTKQYMIRNKCIREKVGITPIVERMVELPLDFSFLQIIEEFQKCHIEHPIRKFFGDCTDLKIKLDRCFRQEKALKRKANFEESKKFKEQLQAFRKENAASSSQ